MDEQEFEGFLASAYRAPSDRPERPELAAAVLARVQRRRRVRTAVLGLAAGIGIGVAGAAVAATGLMSVLADALASAPPEPAMIDPSIVLAVGFVLMLAAAVRNAIRDL
jgi:uncharacterized SAM-binding protein YcdF (DUF218 family)